MGAERPFLRAFDECSLRYAVRFDADFLGCLRAIFANARRASFTEGASGNEEATSGSN